MKEADIMRSIQIAVSQHGHRLFRNNQGFFTVDKRKIRTGLGVGSSDLVGWLGGDGPMRGRFLAIEVKTDKGRLTDEQESFLAAVNRSGGLGFVARSVEEALEKLK